MNTTVKGNIFNISRFSINDGPGIRTTVFLKGCPLHCDWCHNPESMSRFPQLMYRNEKCIGCGKCVSACKRICHSIEEGIHKINIKNCIACGLCVDACQANALEICGEYLNAAEIIQEVKKDKSFYNSLGSCETPENFSKKITNGGMTISGGEPLFQPDFTRELLELAKAENIHTCVETSGMCDREVLIDVAEVTDLFLFDYKHSDSVKLKKYTGAVYSTIYENLRLLEQLNKPVVLRCPIIPSVNDSKTHFDNIINVTNIFSNIIEVNILPYHSFGEQKNKYILSRERNISFKVPSDEEVSGWINYLKRFISNIPVC